MEWIKHDVTAEQIGRDEQECRQLAWREAGSRAALYPIGPIFARDASGRGSMIWPGGAFVDPYAHQFLEESRLAHFCMRSKGYELVPAPKK